MSDDKNNTMEDTNWYEDLKKAFGNNGDDFSKMICTLSEEDLHRRFDHGFGSEEGCSFTAWGEKWVYFPVCYDGSEWVGYAPRNPCNISTNHQGGG